MRTKCRKKFKITLNSVSNLISSLSVCPQKPFLANTFTNRRGNEHAARPTTTAIRGLGQPS